MKRFITTLALICASLVLGVTAANAAVTVLGWGPTYSVAASTVTDLPPQTSAYLVIPAATDDVAAPSFVLDTSRCPGPVNFVLDGDITAATAGATVGLYDCQSFDLNGLGCVPISFDSDADGVPDTNVIAGDPAVGSDHLYGVFARYLGVTVTNTTNTVGYIKATCPWRTN